MNTNAGRARAIVARIRSRRTKDGAFSIFGRLKPEAVEAMAQSIAAAYPNTEIDEDGLTRCALLFVGKNPNAARTHDETMALLNQRRMNEQAKIVIRDVTTTFLQKLTPRQKLEYANTGLLPEPYILKGPHDAE